MGSLIGMLVGRRIFGKVIGEKAARAIAYIGLALLIVMVLGIAKCSYDASVIEDYTAEQRADQAERERGADKKLNDQKQLDEAAAAQRKKEIEDATRNIPDQKPSARQRARACVELRREAKASGRPEPTC